MDDDEIGQVREQVRTVMEREGLSQADVARHSGIKYGTLSSWLNGTYTGRNHKVAEDAARWLRSREEQRAAARAVPQGPGYVETATVGAVMDALRYAQMMGDIAVIAGGAGIGKTTACMRYAETTSNVWLVTINPLISGTFAMLSELAEIMGVTEPRTIKLGGAIGRRLAGSQGEVIVDEAQHLRAPALEMLRSLSDRYGVGLALVGNETVYSRLQGGERKQANFAQLYSRVGMRITQPRPKSQDIDAIIAAWGVDDKTEVSALRAIAGRAGGLRSLVKCLRLAGMLAAGDGGARTIQHIRAAWARLSGTPMGEVAA